MKFKNLEEEIAYLRAEIKKLEDQLAAIQRLVFGKKSERYIKEDPNQLRLDIDAGEPVEQGIPSA